MSMPGMAGVEMNYQNLSEPIPPVTVLSVPESIGPRGYGGKISEHRILLPYNKTVEKTFADIADVRTMVILRDRFFSMQDVG